MKIKINKVKKILFGFVLLFFVIISINCGSKGKTTPTPTPTSDTLIKGADIGWLNEMEATGYTFYDSTGTQIDCLDILKQYRINNIRVKLCT